MHRMAFVALILLSAGLVVGAPDAARAEEEESGAGRSIRPYLAYEAGLSVIPNQNLTGADASGAGLWGRANPDPGFAVGGALGARFSEYLRAEVNLSYRQSDVERLDVAPGPDESSGEIGLFAAMANVYGDLDLDLAWPVVPYLGAGIGYGLWMLDAENPGAVKIDDEDSVFVWNLMAGTTIRYSKVTEISLGYRYVATTDPELNSRITGTGPRRLDSEFDAHEVVLGLRFLY